MNSIVLTKNATLHLQCLPLKTPDIDEVQVKLKAVGICSSDIYRAYDNGAYFYPLIMGHEMSGEIVASGEHSNSYSNGDRVAIFPLLPCFHCESCLDERYAQCNSYKYYGSRNHGGYSQYLNVKEWNLMKIPSSVSWANAAAIEPIATVIHALNKIDKKDKKKLCILGAGFLGLIAAKYLKFICPEFKVSIFDRNSLKLELAKKYCDEVFLCQKEEDWQNIIQPQLDSYPLVLEACGAPETFSHSLSLAARKGKVIWMGNINSDLTLNKKLVSSILRKELNIIGVWNSEYKGNSPSDWTTALMALQNGFSIEEFITENISIFDVPQKIEGLYNNKIKKQKLDVIKYMITEFA